ncbi:hypothetical protein Dimus_002924, partial [Dionaea muscipula]
MLRASFFPPFPAAYSLAEQSLHNPPTAQFLELKTRKLITVRTTWNGTMVGKPAELGAPRRGWLHPMGRKQLMLQQLQLSDEE